jgi:hypothetical protein
MKLIGPLTIVQAQAYVMSSYSAQLSHAFQPIELPSNLARRSDI